MSDVTREFRVVDGRGDEWPFEDLPSADQCARYAAFCERSEPNCGPFRVESRTVTDWLETEQPADSATGCQTHGGNP